MGPRAAGRTRLLTSIWNGDGTPRFPGSDLIDRRTMSRWRYPFEFRKRAADVEAVVVVGSLGFADRYQDVVAGATLKFLPARRRPVLVVTDATWERSSEALARRFGGSAVTTIAARAFIRTLDGSHVVYCVLSEQERSTFADRWGVDDGRVALTHYPTTLEGDAFDRPTSEGDYLFAGGDPLRDYDLLLAATRDLDLDVRIASRRYSASVRPRLTIGAVPTEEFRELEAEARLVVVPLRTDTERSAGQQTYLNALAMGKPLVITDAPGVRDYLIPDEHALIVPPTPEALRAAIDYVLDPANSDEIAAMADRGKSWVRERLTGTRYTQRLQEIAETAVSQRRAGRIDLRPSPRREGPSLPDADGVQ